MPGLIMEETNELKRPVCPGCGAIHKDLPPEPVDLFGGRATGPICGLCEAEGALDEDDDLENAS
jgi:hypothetical protein